MIFPEIVGLQCFALKVYTLIGPSGPIVPGVISFNPNRKVYNQIILIFLSKENAIFIDIRIIYTENVCACIFSKNQQLSYHNPHVGYVTFSNGTR